MAVIIGISMTSMMMIFLIAPVLLIAAARAVAIGPIVAQRRRQVANDNDHHAPAITPRLRTQMRLAAGLLTLAFMLLIVGRFIN